MIKEAIILAGGLGTRLRDAVPDMPKCMAPVAGHPFLFYVIEYLRQQGVTRYIFSLGYKHESVETYLDSTYPQLDKVYVIEEKPLQTGGAIRLALEQVKDKHVLILNGDTLFTVDMHRQMQFHLSHDAECTLALKPMKQFDRYGAVPSSEEGRILSFQEKQYLEAGNINGGVYIMNREAFLKETWPEVFSFETAYLTHFCPQKKFFGYVEDTFFIDIGIPEDYQRAQMELKRFTFPFEQIDSSWTLFLDRDGVINVNKDDSYVFNRNEFIFKEGVPEALSQLSTLFARIIVVTNQRGIGKGLMTVEDLEDIHSFMIEEITSAGGRIDAVYYCTSMDDNHPDRKPNPGMGLKAKENFPEIDLSKSIVVGDKASDMKLGRKLGAKTVWIVSERYKDTFDSSDTDLVCHSLSDFADDLRKAQ